MSLRHILFSLIFLSQAILSADIHKTLPISDIEGGDICMVEGVNVMTGSYNYQIAPLTVQAPETISYHMGYNTDLSWQNNLEVWLWFGFDYCTYYECGTGSHFRRFNDYRDFDYHVKIHEPKNVGLTNLGQGMPSGKTSHRNLRIKVPKADFSNQAILTKGDGSQRIFSRKSG